MKVPAVKTAWATAWDHHAIVVNFDGILRACAVFGDHVRRRLTAHAIVASGWRQAVWNHNPWGVKAGSSWAGDWYEMNTQEDDGTGQLYDVPNDAWRSFPNWAAAVRDQSARISPSSSRYKLAHAALVDASRPDSDYWAELGRAGYYTDTTNMTPSKFGSLCSRVNLELETATEEERTSAERIPVGPIIGIGAALLIAILLFAFTVS
jgi:flagellum-specific peptidoglycan hydrolase FlgJ